MLVEEVKRESLDYGIFERLSEAWSWWREWVPAPARIRVVGDDDSDGITSSYIVGTALRRMGYDVDLKIMPLHTPSDVDVAFKDVRDGYVVLDAGSSLVDYIDSFRVPTLVIDHHRVQEFSPQNTFEVNPRRVGGDRVEHVSTSVLAGLFAVTMGEHWDLAFAGVAGGISDRQHLGGFRGLLGYLAQGAVQHGFLNRSSGLTLVGDTVLEAITDSLDPFFEEYTGKPDAVRGLLARHQIAPNDSPVLVTGDRGLRLSKELTDGLQRRGVVTDRLYPIYEERFLLRHASGVPTVFVLAQLMEAATASKAHEIALRTLAGDPGAARQSKQLVKRRLDGVLRELGRLRSSSRELPHVRWAETQDYPNTGVYAHTLLTFVFGDDRPFLIVSRVGDQAKCSARASKRLYTNGVDLSIALKEAAEAVGGHGGGHPGASGATVAYAKRDEFLAKLNEALGKLRRSPG